jgi:ABC-type branched-subunit amino acid transport system ATPase component
VDGPTGTAELGGLRGLADAVLAAERARTSGEHVAATPPPARGDALLEVRELDVAYGSRQVLFGVDLTVGDGEVVAVLGVNGAGKSTLLGAIAGLLPTKRGTIRFAGQILGRSDAPDRVGRGVALMPGGRAVFPHLTVLDNLLAGCHGFAWDTELVGRRIRETLATFPRLEDRLDQPAGTLSGGEQQMLGLGKALLLSPRLLLIDELSLGLAPVVVAELGTVLEGLKARGTTMVVVEQSHSRAVALADRVVWLDKGAIRQAS